MPSIEEYVSVMRPYLWNKEMLETARNHSCKEERHLIRCHFLSSRQMVHECKMEREVRAEMELERIMAKHSTYEVTFYFEYTFHQHLAVRFENDVMAGVYDHSIRAIRDLHAFVTRFVVAHALSLECRLTVPALRQSTYKMPLQMRKHGESLFTGRMGENPCSEILEYRSMFSHVLSSYRFKSLDGYTSYWKPRSRGK